MRLSCLATAVAVFAALVFLSGSCSRAKNEPTSEGPAARSVAEGAQVRTADGIEIRDAKMIYNVVDSRGTTAISEPQGFAFLRVRVETKKTPKVPNEFELSGVRAIDASGQAYPVRGVGFDTANPDEWVADAVIPVDLNQRDCLAPGCAEKEEVLAQAESEDWRFMLTGGHRGRRSAKLTGKKTPTIVTLYFPVPNRESVFRIEGLATAVLVTNRVPAFRPKQ